MIIFKKNVNAIFDRVTIFSYWRHDHHDRHDHRDHRYDGNDLYHLPLDPLDHFDGEMSGSESMVEARVFE
jgi:hypothetical protein